jgi:regulator of chromosome condensation
MAPRKAAAAQTRAGSSSAPAPAPAASKTTTTRTTASKKATNSIKAPVEATKPAPKAAKRKHEDEVPAAAASKKAKTNITPASKKATATKPAVTKKAVSGPAAPAKAAKQPSTTTTPTTTTKRKRAADDALRAIKKAKKGPVINEAPTQKLDVYVCGEGGSGELGLGTAKLAIDVKRPRLNPLLAKDTVGVVQLDCGGMHVIALTHGKSSLQPPPHVRPARQFPIRASSLRSGEGRDHGRGTFDHS